MTTIPSKKLIENPHAIKIPKITCIDLMLTIVPCSFRSTLSDRNKFL